MINWFAVRRCAIFYTGMFYWASHGWLAVFFCLVYFAIEMSFGVHQ